MMLFKINTKIGRVAADVVQEAVMQQHSMLSMLSRSTSTEVSLKRYEPTFQRLNER
jgi:hypothetical protein